MKRKLFAFLAVIALLGCIALTAFASEPDLEKDGSVTIKLYGNKKVSGGNFVLYRVARLVEEDGAFRFDALDAYDSEVKTFDQKNLNDPDLPEALYKIIKKKNSGIMPNYSGKFEKSSSATVEDVELGVYLVVQNKAIPGYAKFSPFLITVPTNENGVYDYDVESNSKVATPPTTKPDDDPPETTKPSGKLPQTGQLNWPVPVLAAAGLTLFTVGALLRRSGKKEDYES